MKKEDLMKIEGMTEELAVKVAKASLEELNAYVPKERITEVTEAKNNAEALVKERDKQLEELKKSTGDNEALKAQIEQLHLTDTPKMVYRSTHKPINSTRLSIVIISIILLSSDF